MIRRPARSPVTRARLVSWLVLALASSALGDEAASPRVGTRRALIVCGLPGDAEHRTLFAGAVESIRKGLVDRLGFPASEVLVRFGAPRQAGDGPALSGGRGLSDRAGIAADVAEVRRRVAPEDTLWVIVLGHAHFDGRRSHLNLPGPDLSDEEFGALFRGIRARELIVMVTTPASGFFLKPLAAPGRILIAATEADQEVNETLFPLALAGVLASPPEDIDRDKDGSVSVLELYLAVAADVAKRYADEEDIPTEHAQIDDNGDGRGSEPQLDLLPPELGGHPRQGPPPTLGPKDDGALAAKVRVGPRDAGATPDPRSTAPDRARPPSTTP